MTSVRSDQIDDEIDRHLDSKVFFTRFILLHNLNAMLPLFLLITQLKHVDLTQTLTQSNQPSVLAILVLTSFSLVEIRRRKQIKEFTHKASTRLYHHV